LARKILLADDSVTAQNMGRKILADAGYEVITVNNGSAALKKIAETKPDLIVLDVYMPGYSGLEVCQRLKEAGETARIPVLLTVGKLEPFKPEEAKRVRAEGFIVKPFEASELLSALTKLEDKMVPRSEPSKPGRFARTIAAVEEGRYDKTMAADEDSGWKNRISFPSKKKSKTAEPDDSNDPAIYNPVNKDLRTVVESKPAPETSAPAAKAATKTEEPRVDLGALAPEGLPKDVTAEEIAALAAAAAQMQGKIQAQTQTSPEESRADSKVVEATSGDAKMADSTFANSKIEEVKASEPVPVQPSVQELAQESAKPEERTAAAEPTAAATFTEQNLEEKKTEAVAEAASGYLPGRGEVTAAIAALETPSGPSSNSGMADASPDRDRKAEAEPVTMALAAAQSSSGSRWTAVAVSVAPEESGIALEHEMRKAYAAYAAYDGAASRPAQEISSVSEALPAVMAAVAAEIAAPVETPQPGAESTTAQTSEAAPTALAAGIAAGEASAVSARVKSFETVAASSEAKPDEAKRDEFKSDEVRADEVKLAALAPLAEAVASAPETQPVEAPAMEAKGSEVTGAHETNPQTVPEAPSPAASEPPKYEEPVTPKAELDRIDPAQVDPVRDERLHSEPVHDETAKYDEPVPAAFTPYPLSAAADETQAIRKEEAEAPGLSPVARDEALATAAEPVASSEQAVSVVHDGSSHDGSGKEKAAPGKEPDIAATTAAAWASWRRIRESGNPKDATEPGKPEDATSASRDEAAMAVAAGAETAPEGPEIASIVDSVLADLRPKIMEEISKKFKKK
jgi:CheY-like chemotaxis protein